MPQFDATIREVIRETPDSVTLVLDTATTPDYRAGQFLSIDPHALDATRERAAELEVRKGKKERPRAYSVASAPHEPQVTITVKDEPDGVFPALMSPYLARAAKPGDPLPFTGFNGLYALPRELAADAHLVHVCAGSGIVPNWSMLKDALHRGLPNRHTLLYSNKSWNETIYRTDLLRLVDGAAGKVRLVLCLTRDTTVPAEVTDVLARTGGTVVGRRIDLDLLRETIGDSAGSTHAFACGPSTTQHERAAARARGEKAAPKFLETVRHWLLEDLALDKSRVSTEGW